MDLSYIQGMNLRMISAKEAKSEKFGVDLPADFKAKIIAALDEGCRVAEIYASKVKIAYFICEYVKEYFGEPDYDAIVANATDKIKSGYIKAVKTTSRAAYIIKDKYIKEEYAEHADKMRSTVASFLCAYKEVFGVEMDGMLYGRIIKRTKVKSYGNFMIGIPLGLLFGLCMKSVWFGLCMGAAFGMLFSLFPSENKEDIWVPYEITDENKKLSYTNSMKTYFSELQDKEETPSNTEDSSESDDEE